MKNYFAILVLLLPLTFLGCPPKPSPVPPPQDVCGDLRCTGAETPATCPGDCPIEPPPPTCPDGSCVAPETPETCPQDCGTPEPPPAPIKPKYKIGDPLIQLGFWEVTSQPNFDYDAYAADIYYDSPINSVGRHTFTPWGSTTTIGKQSEEMWGPFAWDKNKRKYTGAMNEAWWADNEKFLAALEKYGIHLHDSIHDQYQDPKYAGVGICKAFPLVHNNVGQLLPKQLYNDWDGSGDKPTDFAWLQWYTDDSVPTAKYVLNGRGKFLAVYHKRLFESYAKHPKLSVTWKVYNEERAPQVKHSDGSWHADPSKSIGGQDKIKFWIYNEIAKKAGIKKSRGGQYQETQDFLAYIGFDPNRSPYPYIVEWKNMKGNYNFITTWSNNKACETSPKYKNPTTGKDIACGQESILEIHQIRSMAAVAEFASNGIPANGDVLWSCDGCREDDKLIPDQKKMVAAVKSGQIKMYEMKFSLDKAQNDKYWKPTNHQKSWDDMWPRIRDGMGFQKQPRPSK